MADYLAIAPEIGLLALLFVVLGYKSFVKDASGRTAGLIAAWGTFLILLLTAILSITVWQGGGQEEIWGNMIRNDGVSIVFRVMFLIALLLTCLLSLDNEDTAQAEFFALLIAATMGFNFMAMAIDMIMILVALETASISLYLLAGYVTKDQRSAEAGMKYFVYGAFASALMLYGMSFIYGITSQTNIYRIGLIFSSPNVTDAQMLQLNSLLLVSGILLIAGFGFKVSVVPFHWWAPDVYEGAPTSVTGFASTASKAAGFAVFFRFFLAGSVGQVSQTESIWWSLIVAICVITMLLGNMLAIYQKNLKRMLAYSSIAQAGYVVIGLVTLTSEGSAAAMYYLLMYVVTNIVAFGVIIIISQKDGKGDMEDLYGLSRRSPYLALAMLMALLSLGGIPPTGGFFGKFFLFRAAVDAGLWQLAMAGILLAFISLYYYLNVVKYIYLYRNEDTEMQQLPISRAAKVALGLGVAGILYLGIFAGPAFEWTQDAAQWFFSG